VLPNLLYRTGKPVCGMVCGMRLSDQQKKISELCSKVIATNDPTEFAQAVVELRVALHAQLNHLKELIYNAQQTIAQLPAPLPFDRRKMERRKMERRR
jgi:hypothetical protein